MRITTLCLALATLAAALQWDSVAPLPEPRYSGCAVELAGRVYYLGGSAAGGIKTRTVFVYDPEANTWTIGTPMLVARHRFGAAALDGRIYAFGGWGEAGNLLDAAEAFDTLTGTWSHIEPLPSPRASHGGRAAAGKVWSIGGRNSTATLRRLDAYDPGTGHWQEYAPMPTPRCEAAWASGWDWVGALGGTDHLGVTILDNVEFYDAVDDNWYTHPPMPWPRAAAGSHNNARNFYVVGGWAPGARLTPNLFQYDAWRQVWREWASLSVARAFLAVACIEPWLFAIGGQVSGQPVALVERIERPLALEEMPAVSLAASAPGRVIRPGAPLPGPTGRDAVLVSADGRVGARTRPGAACPALAPGVWFLCTGTDRARLVVLP
ncbi:MAG: kelch repeat-containing protein [bacterium]